MICSAALKLQPLRKCRRKSGIDQSTGSNFCGNGKKEYAARRMPNEKIGDVI